MIRAFLICCLLYVPSIFAQQKSVLEFTSGMDEKAGFFTLYHDANMGKVYLRIDTLEQQFLFQSSMPQGIGSNDIGLDRGQLGDTRLVQFERFGDKVLLKQLNTEFRVIGNNAAEKASIDEAFADSVIAGLTIVANDDNAVLVDYTPFLLSDIHGIGDRLDRTKQGSYRVDAARSGVYANRTKSFPNNTEMEALITFAGTKPGEYVQQVAPDAKSVSVHLHHSLVRLPDNNYTPRKFDTFSGYWKMSFKDYGAAVDADMEQRFIPRHRLNKKNPAAKISEAIEPIIYYLDPGIPEPVKGALLDGALWWNQAFTHIGYKDAFQVKVLPEGADPMDVRYNVIQWVHRATRGWSYGSSVIDPRTGEIIKGHVTLGSLRVRQDYLIALGLTSPFDSADATTDAQLQMALARIRQLSAHEVGHTLGIAHNFSASKNNRASVMDYPHPYVTIEDGQIDLSNAYDTGIGEWDKYVIEYGYQDYSGKNSSLELQTLVDQARAKGFLYQSDPDARAKHAANDNGHLWDNGSDPVDELNRISKVRALALQNFGINSLPDGSPLSTLQERLVPIYYLHRYQLDAVVKLIGGVYYEYESKGDYQLAKGVTPVDAKRQQNALQAMIDTMSPEYLALPSDLIKLVTPKTYGDFNTRESFKGRTGITFDPVSAAESAVGYSLSLLLAPQRLNRMQLQHQLNNKTPGISQMLDKVFSANIQNSQSKKGQELQLRVAYVTLNSVMQTLDNELLAPEVRGEMIYQLMRLHKWLKNNKRNHHNTVMAKQLDWYWQTGEWTSTFDVKPLPPGSPI